MMNKYKIIHAALIALLLSLPCAYASTNELDHTPQVESLVEALGTNAGYSVVIDVHDLLIGSAAETNEVLIPSQYQIRKALELYHSTHKACAICGIKKSLEGKARNPVHHVTPVHIDRDLSTNQLNMVTLCIGHHFVVGHTGNYKKVNPNLRRDVELLNAIYTKIREGGLTKDEYLERQIKLLR